MHKVHQQASAEVGLQPRAPDTRCTTSRYDLPLGLGSIDLVGHIQLLSVSSIVSCLYLSLRAWALFTWYTEGTK